MSEVEEKKVKKKRDTNHKNRSITAEGKEKENRKKVVKNT